MELCEDILHQLRALKYKIEQEYKAVIVGIFGSYVRNEQRADSDIDVLVRFERGATLLDCSGLKIFLEQQLKRKVDIVPVDAIRREIKDEILRESIYL